MTKRLEVRGSNSAFFKDGKFISGSGAGCPRITLLRHHDIQDPVEDIRTQKTFAVGKLNEELFIKHYLANSFVRREGEIDEPITEKTSFVGHIDVEAGKVLFELKSVTSNNTWKLVKDGGYKVENLAQAVNYMLSRRLQKGYLVYSLYAYVAGLDLPDVFLEITIDDDGNILVNNKQTGFNLEHTVLDRQTKARVLEEQMVYPERPVNPGSDKNPCGYCPFKSVCDAWDSGRLASTETFIAQCKEITNATKLQQSISRHGRSKQEKEITSKRR